MRKLASIRKISQIKPHPNADRLDIAIIDGWQAIVGKDQYKSGEMVVYIEIDSVLPDNETFAEARKYAPRKVKTVRLRGELSQGLVMPLSILPDSVDENNNLLKIYVEGDDVTEILGITKYDPPLPKTTGNVQAKGHWPAMLTKTDEERIQNAPWLLEKYAGTPFYITEKLDGSSFTAYFYNGDFGVCSRNLELKLEADNSWTRIARKYNLAEKLQNLGKNLALQGEIVGPGVREVYGLKEVELFLFNIFDIDKQEYLSYNEFVELAEDLDLKTVPVLDANFFLDGYNLSDILTMAEGKSILDDLTEREGLVFRPKQELRDFKFGRVSFKAISNNYLLKGKDD